VKKTILVIMIGYFIFVSNTFAVQNELSTKQSNLETSEQMRPIDYPRRLQVRISPFSTLLNRYILDTSYRISEQWSAGFIYDHASPTSNYNSKSDFSGYGIQSFYFAHEPYTSSWYINPRLKFYEGRNGSMSPIFGETNFTGYSGEVFIGHQWHWGTHFVLALSFGGSKRWLVSSDSIARGTSESSADSTLYKIDFELKTGWTF
jgi:hypothetical protein